MELKQFLALAADVHPEELGPFALLTQAYLDTRAEGKRGLVTERVEPEQVEYLLQLFEYDDASGTYVHPGIDGTIKAPSQADAALALFPEFWAAYPRHVAKAAAQRAWKAKVKTVELAEKIIAAVKAHAAHHNWADKERIEFIPHPGTWLNQQRWEDELVPVVKRFVWSGPRVDALVGVR